MRRLADVGLGFAAGVALTAAAAPGVVAPPAPPPAAPAAELSGVRARALAVVDGDTFEARVAVFPGQEIVTRVRIAGVDAPERNGRCAAERDAAQKATAALRAMVEDRNLTLSQVRAGKYFGRVLATVATADTPDVAGALIAAGHGRPYAGGRRAGWC